MLRKLPLRFLPDPGFASLREDLSALVLTPEGHLWLAADESPSLERLTWDGTGFSRHEAFPIVDYLDLPAGAEEEIDIEGLSYDGPYLWLVGSHSRKMRKPKGESAKKDIKRLTFAETSTEPNRYLLGRIPMVGGRLFASCPNPHKPNEVVTAASLKIEDDSNALVEALKDDPHIGPYLAAGIPGKANGLDIEGLEAFGNRILLGLRGPVLLDWAILIEIEMKQKNSGTLALKKIGPNDELYRKHFVNLQGLGVRDLCQQGDDLLILAGPTLFLDGPAKIFRLKELNRLDSDKMHLPEMILEIPCGIGTDHPEGITLADFVTGEPTLLVIYDAPQATRRLEPNGVQADVFSLQEP